LRNPKNANLFKKLGVDVTVSATDIIMEAIEREVPTHPVTQLLNLEEKGLVLIDVRIGPGSATVGKPVKDLTLPKESKLALIIPMEGSAYVPAPHTILQAGDQVIAVTPPDTTEALRAALSGK
jgi:trk system potassium uptake protein TrkA